jgi:uncharacterized protein involved in exopolysaccharide biosynthesis
MTEYNTDYNKEENEESTISIMEIIGLFIKHWKWFVLGLIVALGLAFIYLRYTTPVYEVTSSVILKDEKEAKANRMMTPYFIHCKRSYQRYRFIYRQSRDCGNGAE